MSYIPSPYCATKNQIIDRVSVEILRIYPCRAARRVRYFGRGHGEPGSFDVPFDDIVAITYHRWRDMEFGLRIAVALDAGRYFAWVSQHIPFEPSHLADLARSIGCGFISNDVLAVKWPC